LPPGFFPSVCTVIVTYVFDSLVNTSRAMCLILFVKREKDGLKQCVWSVVCRAGLTEHPGLSVTRRRQPTQNTTKTTKKSFPSRRTTTTTTVRTRRTTTTTPSCMPTCRRPPVRLRRQRLTCDTCECWTGQPDAAFRTTRRLCSRSTYSLSSARRTATKITFSFTACE